MSSSTRCSVWEVSVTKKSRSLEEQNRIVFGKSPFSKMESQWNSSGKYSQDSLHWASSKRIPTNYNWITVWTRTVSLEGSSSCQCTTTLYGENEETQKTCETNSVTVANYAHRFPLGRWSFLGPGSEKKWSLEPTSTNLMETGRKLLKAWCSTFAENGHLVFRRLGKRRV